MGSKTIETGVIVVSPCHAFAGGGILELELTTRMAFMVRGAFTFAGPDGHDWLHTGAVTAGLASLLRHDPVDPSLHGLHHNQQRAPIERWVRADNFVALGAREGGQRLGHITVYP